MKISAQEQLLFNKNLNLNNAKGMTNAIAAEPPVDTPETKMSALDAMAQNNITFQAGSKVMQAVKNVPAEYLDKVMERAENAGETKDAIETEVMKDLDNINSEADISKAHKRTQGYLDNIAKKMSFTKEDYPYLRSHFVRSKQGIVDDNILTVSPFIPLEEPTRVFVEVPEVDREAFDKYLSSNPLSF